jgi:hypothetical protein
MDADLDKDDFVGYGVVPFSCMATGYRHLDIFNESGVREGEYKFATLFVRISVEDL